VLPEPGAQIRLDGSLVTVVAASSKPYGADLVIRRGDGTLADVALTHAELDQGSVICGLSCPAAAVMLQSPGTARIPAVQQVP